MLAEHEPTNPNQQAHDQRDFRHEILTPKTEKFRFQDHKNSLCKSSQIYDLVLNYPKNYRL